MQNTSIHRTFTRGAVQIVVLAAVAAVGLSVGRWVVPDNGSTGASAVRYDNPARPAGPDIIESKLAQMDAQDARYTPADAAAAGASSLPRGDSIIERKLAEMDALDSRSEGSSDNSATTIERKFAQMEAEDAH